MQFSGKEYSSQQIVMRALYNCDRFDFPSHIIVDRPYLLRDYFGELFLKGREILLGKRNLLVFNSSEKEALEAFQEKYLPKIKRLRIADVCYEDYYLLHDLLCQELHIGNPEMFVVREGMRLAYLYSIYNSGKLNQLYLQYSEGFHDYLIEFDHIFSTNYDLNIENATGKAVVHIHGQFDRLRDVYNPDSLRNKMPDAPIQNADIDPNYAYLYSNAITTHSGSYKEFIIKQNHSANTAVERMADAYKKDPKIKSEVDDWISNKNQIVANLGYAIRLKANYPELQFSEQYDFEEFKNMSGELIILGLSPWNDFHIFNTIDTSKIESCLYYYNSEQSCEKVKTLLPHLTTSGKLSFLPAAEIWRR